MENEPHTETVLTERLDEIGGKNLSFANKSALDLERDEATKNDDTGGIAERGDVITTSFKKVVAMRSIGGARVDVQPKNSPLMTYSPRGVTVPPDEVKGGYACWIE